MDRTVIRDALIAAIAESQSEPWAEVARRHGGSALIALEQGDMLSAWLAVTCVAFNCETALWWTLARDIGAEVGNA